ncbi:MAG: hypothetical protein E7390_08630, partial [Ruminococcaceae bacterium]|nr:hypothetical protein [Oscillospiraceae bacterium]
RDELIHEGIEIAGDTELGIMIETPASAIIADKLAPMVDFFSVGTNDLTQYTLACDRQNPLLETFCDTHHEAVLRLIAYAAKCAHSEGKWIGICGELAADPDLLPTFLAIGIDELSVTPSAVLPLPAPTPAAIPSGRLCMAMAITNSKTRLRLWMSGCASSSVPVGR